MRRKRPAPSAGSAPSSKRRTKRAAAPSAAQIELPAAEPAPSAARADAWPEDAPAQFIALRAALAGGLASAKEIARRFRNAPRGPKLAGMLETLSALG